MRVSFDILKKDKNGTFTWVEAVNDLDTAKIRLKQLSQDSTEEFVVFRNVDLRLVASSEGKRV